MKILFTNDAPLIKYGIARGCEKAGAEVKICPLWKIAPEEQEIRFSEVVEEFKPEIVFAEGHSGLHQPSFFKCIDKMGLNLFYWAIEDPVHMDWISLPYARKSKFTFTTAVECVNLYKKAGISADTLLFACDPDYHYTTAPVAKYQHDIVFVGSNYDIRYDAARMMVLPLVEKGYDIKVWGSWWQDPKRPVRLPDQNYGGHLPYEYLPEVYSSAKIVLGLHCDGSSQTQTSMRTYEALGCGGFYLTQYTLAHEQLFTNKKHLVWSQSAEETVRYVDYFLQNETQRKQIARDGQKHVYTFHTYHQRAEQILNIAEKIL